jgi:hypothetical protein
MRVSVWRRRTQMGLSPSSSPISIAAGRTSGALSPPSITAAGVASQTSMRRCDAAPRAEGLGAAGPDAVATVGADHDENRCESRR